MRLLVIDKSTRHEASALIAVLWVVAILSLIVFSATHFLFIGLESNGNDSTLFRAEQLADQGIALGAHPDVSPGDPILRQTVSEAESFFTRISSEGERLHLNQLLVEHETNRVVLEELFVLWGLPFEEANDVVDNLIDWIDSDDTPTNLGAEQSFYQGQNREGHPFNRPFYSLEETPLVHEFEKVTAVKPDWADSFTLLSSGKLDLNEAPGDLIQAACQCSETAAEALVEVRAGYDRIHGTEDDVHFKSVSEALNLLGIPPEFSEGVANRVTVADPIRRIVSIGRYGPIAVERVVTFPYSADAGQVLQWTTRRVE